MTNQELKDQWVYHIKQVYDSNFNMTLSELQTLFPQFTIQQLKNILMEI